MKGRRIGAGSGMSTPGGRRRETSGAPREKSGGNAAAVDL